MPKTEGEIIAKHLTRLNAKDLEKFKQNLCQLKSPIKTGKIDMEDLQNKCVKDISEIIVRRLTTTHARKMVSKCLLIMKENQIRKDLNIEFNNLDEKKKKIKTPRKGHIQGKGLGSPDGPTKKHIEETEEEIKPRPNDESGLECKTPKKRARREQSSDAAPIKMGRPQQSSVQPDKGEVLASPDEPTRKQLAKAEVDMKIVAGPSGAIEIASKTPKKRERKGQQSDTVPRKRGKPKKTSVQPDEENGKPARTARDALRDALLELEEDELKSFRNKLNGWDIKEDYRRIPKGKLQNKNAEEVVDLILCSYTSYGHELTVEVLKAINQRKVAEELQKDLVQVSGAKRRVRSQATTSSS